MTDSEYGKTSQRFSTRQTPAWIMARILSRITITVQLLQTGGDVHSRLPGLLSLAMDECDPCSTGMVV